MEHQEQAISPYEPTRKEHERAALEQEAGEILAAALQIIEQENEPLSTERRKYLYWKSGSFSAVHLSTKSREYSPPQIKNLIYMAEVMKTNISWTR